MSESGQEGKEGWRETRVVVVRGKGGGRGRMVAQNWGTESKEGRLPIIGRNTTQTKRLTAQQDESNPPAWKIRHGSVGNRQRGKTKR